MRDDEILAVLETVRDAVAETVDRPQHRGYSGVRETQYHLDLDADRVALSILHGAGFSVISEESGRSGDGDVTIVIDPVDGSTNCDRGVPFFATSMAALVDGELRVGLVANLATGTTYTAVKGQGATRDGLPIASSGHQTVEGSIVAFSGLPSRYAGWAQFRALGAAALEICLVADGSLDWYSVTSRSSLHPWDYLGGLLVAREAGAVAGDYDNVDLVRTGATGSRPFFAASVSLLDEVRTLGPL